MSTSVSVTELGEQPMPAPGPAAELGEKPAPAPRPGRRRAVIIAVVVAVLVVAGCVGAAWWHEAERNRIAYEDAHATHAVSLPLTVTSFDTSTGSKLPVHVTGKNADGDYDEVQFADDQGNGLELARGSYTLAFPASPIAADGTLYDVPQTTYNLEIGDDTPRDATVSLQLGDGDQLSVAPVQDPTAITDDQLNTAKDYASRDGACEDGVDSSALGDAATTKRDNAVAEKKAAEEKAAAEKKAAEEKAAAEAAAAEKAKYHVETKNFTFDAPSYWYGRVTLSANEYGITVYSSKYPNREICRLLSSQNYLNTHSFGGMITLGDDGSQGYFVFFEDIGAMVSVYASTGSTDPNAQFSEEEADELVDLQTGGRYKTLADFQTAAASEIPTSVPIMGGATQTTTDALTAVLNGCITVHY